MIAFASGGKRRVARGGVKSSGDNYLDSRGKAAGLLALSCT